MSDDKKLSELVSKSMRRELSPEESSILESHIGHNEEARKFAQWSKQIQDSMAGLPVAESDDFDFEPVGLSDEFRSKLQDSISSAIDEKASISKAGLIDDVEATYARPNTNIETNDERAMMVRFERIRKLGQGGIGNVWLARDTRLNRSVAIKELNTGARDSERAWKRFHREAAITGHLEHPNVVPLYVFGIDETTGEPFYAMRFVGKRNLSNAIEEHHDRVDAGQADSLSLHRLLNIFLDICQAIAYAHSRGVIHRDLKPENVALDNFGQVIVLDWGLAKILEDSELGLRIDKNLGADLSTASQTLNGEVVGTPLFMAPEQASGDLDYVDKRTDVYGLGAILFAILTGHAPHEGSVNESKSSIQELLDRIATAKTPLPSEYDKNIPLELESICMRAMAVKSHLRFDSVEQLAEAVESWIAGQSSKQAELEVLKMEGRELRSDMQNRVRDFERNVRFCSNLPPIDQLIVAESEEDIAVWRQRLASIFEGLLKANPDYKSIIYARVADDKFSEMVRVEKQSNDAFSIRVVPKSRLRTGDLHDYLKVVIQKSPGEVHTSLVCDKMCNSGVNCSETVGLLASIPVFDNRTEEIFGFVLINCDVDKMLRNQLSRRYTAGEVMVACDVFHVMIHSRNGQIIEDSYSQKVADVSPQFGKAIEKLQSNLDYVDADNDICGARLWFVPDRHGIMYLLKRDRGGVKSSRRNATQPLL